MGSAAVAEPHDGQIKLVSSGVGNLPNAAGPAAITALACIIAISIVDDRPPGGGNAAGINPLER